jgi:hypothetical protein
MAPAQTSALVSLNKTPARAALLVNQLLDTVRPEQDIAHVANAASAYHQAGSIVMGSVDALPAILDLEIVMGSLVQPPSILVSPLDLPCTVHWADYYDQICSSQWTAEEQDRAALVALMIVPDIHIIRIPPGLDQREGGEAIVAFLVDSVRSLTM